MIEARGNAGVPTVVTIGLLAAVSFGCGGAGAPDVPIRSGAPETSGAAETQGAAEATGALDTPADAGARHLIFLHGAIVQEQQNARPQHPLFGYYELREILDTFRERGFVVVGEIRPKDATVSDTSDHVVAQVRDLLDAGVPADHITVVGASMGAAIALTVSARLQNPDLRFGVLGACLSRGAASLLSGEGKGLSGRILSIREASDELTEPCPSWPAGESPDRDPFVRETVLETGLGHGFHYRPLPEWVDPVADWAGAPGMPGNGP